MATQIGSYDFRAANQARQSIEVGGRNLIRLPHSSDEWQEVSGTSTEYYLQFWEPYELEVGVTYTFSGIIEKVSNDNVAVRVTCGNGNKTYGHDLAGWQTFPTYGVKFSITYTVKDGDLSAGSNFAWRIRNEKQATTVRYKNIMLEKSTIASNWKPAEEDTEANILASGVEYIVGTQTAATNKWTGVTKEAALVAGKTIAYQLPFAGTSSAAVLNLTLSGGQTTGEKAIKMMYSLTSNTSALSDITTHYPVGSILNMTYDGSRWIVSNYNTNINQIDRINHNNLLKAASANATGKSYAIAGSTLIGYVPSLGGYQTIVAGSVIDISKPILWGTGNVAVNATFLNAYEVYPSQTLRNNIASWTGTTYDTAYLKGTLYGNSFTVDSSVFQSGPPSMEDGKIYIPVGVLYSTYQVCFRSSSELWAYLDGKFRQVSASTIVATHRIYYRTATANASLAAPQTWVAEATGNVYDDWTTKVPPLSAKNGVASTDEDATKYLYLYTCEQRKRLDGTTECTKVLLDENTTIIDGGQIVTNSIAANKLTVYNADIGKIKSQYIDVGAIDIRSTANYSDVETAIVNSASWFGTCATAAGEAVKVINRADLVPASPAFPTTLRNGTTVQVKFSVANTAAVGSLQLNVAGTGAKNIKYIYNNSIANLPAVGYLIAGIAYTFVYDGTYWVLQNLNYNTNDNYYDRMRLVQAVRIATGINYPQYAVGGRSFDTSKNGYIALSSGAQIDLSYPIAYLAQANASGQTYAVAGGGTTTNFYTSMNGVTLTYTKSGWSGTNYAMCYIKGELDGVKFTVHSDIFTTTVPTSDDGYVYIPIGMMYSTTAVKFQCNNDVYAYRNGKFGPLALQELFKTSSDISNQFTMVNDSILDLQDDIDATNETYSHLIREVDGKVETALIDSNGQYVGYRTVQSADGTDIYAPDSGESTAHYGATSRIGKMSELHIETRPDRMSFLSSGFSLPGTSTTVDPDSALPGEVAYLATSEDAYGNAESTFYIVHSVVVQDLRFGNWKWWNRFNNNMTLKWMGDD